ncbi:transmembrane protein [Cyclospora cayetanensis]|uniref:Transmembrane protein n=1 Tax=Cyclospora cayetanensis TaxID=88456 RepID=A0A1D3CQW6_9EIME|nr:transmembrane protein [Cyclospora cayetanensis]
MPGVFEHGTELPDLYPAVGGALFGGLASLVVAQVLLEATLSPFVAGCVALLLLFASFLYLQRALTISAIPPPALPGAEDEEADAFAQQETGYSGGLRLPESLCYQSQQRAKKALVGLAKGRDRLRRVLIAAGSSSIPEEYSAQLVTVFCGTMALGAAFGYFFALFDAGDPSSSIYLVRYRFGCVPFAVFISALLGIAVNRTGSAEGSDPASTTAAEACDFSAAGADELPNNHEPRRLRQPTATPEDDGVQRQQPQRQSSQAAFLDDFAEGESLEFL